MSLSSKLRRALNTKAGQGETFEVRLVGRKGGPKVARRERDFIVRAGCYRRGIGMRGMVYLDHMVTAEVLRLSTLGVDGIADVILDRLRSDPRHPDHPMWDGRPYSAELADTTAATRDSIRGLPGTVESVNVSPTTSPESPTA